MTLQETLNHILVRLPANRQQQLVEFAQFLAWQSELAERQAQLYDDSPWTPEEADALALEAGTSLGWDAMDEYDDYSRKP